MARTMVSTGSEPDHVPFLRGILTQSLCKAGLSFEDAYAMADLVKAELKDVAEISSDQLRDRVAEKLVAQYGKERLGVYLTNPTAEADVIVHWPARSEAFSVGVLTRSLEACCIERWVASAAIQAVQEELRGAGTREINYKKLLRLIYESLRDNASPKLANRYLSWQRFVNSGDPMILLLGGITGSGKSTISTELSYRLDIPRTQSTDMIREIIRSYITLEVAPTLQYSTFEAWRGLPNLESGTSGSRARSLLFRKGEGRVVTGFLTQFNVVKPALDAALARAAQEREHLILEGVHVVPTELDLERAAETGVVLPVMIAMTNKKTLRARFERRGREQSERGAQRYLDHLDEIWELQSYLLSAADSANIPIIQNDHMEDTIQELLEILSRLVVKRYPAKPDEMDWGA